MRCSTMRGSPARWRTIGGMAMTVAAVALIGFTTIAPARADYDDWREDRPRAGIYFNFGTPQPWGYCDSPPGPAPAGLFA
jgi:hypothetical protein